MPYPKNYQEDEVIEMAWKLQLENPELSEGAICGLMHCWREYIADLSKKSEAVKELRGRMAAVRQAAWEREGLSLIRSPSSRTNPIIYIWMTRNILGWRNEPAAQLQLAAPETKDVVPERVITPAEYLAEVRARREQREKELKQEIQEGTK